MDFDWVEGRVPISSNQELIKTAVGIPTEVILINYISIIQKEEAMKNFVKL